MHAGQLIPPQSTSVSSSSLTWLTHSTPVGEAVGDVVGLAVGATDVGDEDGACVGVVVGAEVVGANVGEAVGMGVLHRRGIVNWQSLLRQSDNNSHLPPAEHAGHS